MMEAIEVVEAKRPAKGAESVVYPQMGYSDAGTRRGKEM